MWERIRKAFEDAQGDLNLAECVGFPAAVAGIGASLYDVLVRGSHLDLQSYGLGIGAIIAAVGAAQRLRGDPEIDRSRQ